MQMDFYEKLSQFKRLHKLSNESLGRYVDMSGDAFRMAIKRESLSKLEIGILEQLFGDPNIKSSLLTSYIEHKWKDIIEEADKSVLEHIKPKRSVAKKTFVSGRPFYDIDFTLGIQELGEDNTYNPEFNIDFPLANKESINWYPAKGNSMIGEINSGDYLALEEIKDFSWFPLGLIYGIVTKNGIRTIKKIVKSEDKDSYLLVSSNPDKFNFPDQDIPKKMISKLFRVAWIIKELD